MAQVAAFIAHDGQTGMLFNNLLNYFLGRRICSGNCDPYHSLATID
jgi:hypothetical protein